MTHMLNRTQRPVLAHPALLLLLLTIFWVVGRGLGELWLGQAGTFWLA